MSKRKIILIATILIIIIVLVLVLVSIYKPTNSTDTNTGGTNFFSQFFPFGKGTTNNSQNPSTPTDISGYVPPTNTPGAQEKLAKVSSFPIAGYGVFMKERYKQETPNPVVENPLPPETEFVPALRYVEKATGNIYQTFADKIEERNFTTTLVPAVHEAFFGNGTDSVIMRYLKADNKTIETFVGSLPKEILGGDTEAGELTGSFLPENITSLSVSPDSLAIFYLFNSGENTIGVTASALGEKKYQVFSSPYTEWLTDWPNSRMVTLTTKPSYGFPGFMYAVDPNTKKLSKILSGINGLTTLTNPDGKLILYSNNGLALRVYNTDTENSVSFGIKTLPEKCVWSRVATSIFYCAVPKYTGASNYPDTWYQGETSFSDELWKIDAENGTTTMLADPLAFNQGEEIDGVNLSLDQNENYLFLMNKKDSSLWEFYLN
jgi:hypothetical protein